MSYPIFTLRSAARWTPILMFHEAVPDGMPLPAYGVSRSMLRAILSDFAGRGYKPGSLDDALPGSARKGRGKRLVLTFDDGTVDFLEHAEPVLDEFGFRAALFIVAGKIGGVRDWTTTGGEPMPPVPLMSAGQLRELRSRGHEIGSHTLTHCSLPRLPLRQAYEELNGSRRVLSELLGESVDWFAYPFIASNEVVRAQVREVGYKAALGGLNRPHERYFLNRFDASMFTLPQLRMRTNPLYHFTRQMARTVRYRGR